MILVSETEHSFSKSKSSTLRFMVSRYGHCLKVIFTDGSSGSESSSSLILSFRFRDNSSRTFSDDFSVFAIFPVSGVTLSHCSLDIFVLGSVLQLNLINKWIVSTTFRK